MFCPDTVNDTTPDVLELVRSLFPTLPSANPAADRHTSCSVVSTQRESGLKDRWSSAMDSVPVHGHVLLSSLRRVAALARRHELLVQSTRSAWPSPSSTLPASALSSSSVLVRLVLSLLSFSATEDVRSSTTPTEKRDVGSVARAAPTRHAGSSSSADSAHPPSALSSSMDDDDDDDGGGGDGTTLLPWCTVSAPGATDITYVARCVQHETGQSSSSHQCGVHGCEEDGNAPSSASVSVPGHGGLCCRIEVRSYPVAVFTTNTVRSLSQYWHCVASSAGREREREEVEGKEGGTGAASPAAVDTNSSDGSSAERCCLAAALADFRACVCRHELRSLRSVAHACERLLLRLDVLSSDQREAGSSEDEGLEGGSEAQQGGASDAATVIVIPVPMYGVALSMEDNQDTRLERVGHLTTPLLREATGEQSPLRALTAVLLQLEAWATDAPERQHPSRATPSEAQAAPSRLLSSQATPDADTAKASTAHLQLPLLLTRARLSRLHACVTQVLQTESLSLLISASSPTFEAPAASIASLDVMKSAAPDVLLPACLVHCQLGVSRSPSVVLLYYMDVFQPQWRRAAQLQSQARRPAKESSVSAATSLVDRTVAVEGFYTLLRALVRARARVKPNVCFAVQLLSLWNKCVG